MNAALTAPPAPAGILTDPCERFSKHRRFTAPLVRLLMAKTETREVGRQIANCALLLDLQIEQQPDGQFWAQLEGARFCTKRVCPFCDWRRSMRWRRRIAEGLHALGREQPKLRPLLLTLTLKTCELHELSGQLDHLHRSVNILTRRSFFPTDLWVRKTEITYPLRHGGEKRRPQTTDGGDPGMIPLGGHMAHAHVHMLLMVRPSYWGRDYIRSKRWTEEWMTAARIDYCPVVDVRAITTAKSSRWDGDVYFAAAMEVGKYITKASDYAALGGELPKILRQVHGKRLIGCSKSMRRFISDSEISAAELTDLPHYENEEGWPTSKARAHWIEAAQEYWLAATEGGECPSGAAGAAGGSLRALSPRSRPDQKVS